MVHARFQTDGTVCGGVKRERWSLVARARADTRSLTDPARWADLLGPAGPVLADVVLIAGVGLVASTWLVDTRAYGPTVWLLEAALLLPLLLRRRYPVTVLGVLVLVAAVQWLIGIELVADVSLLIALYTVAARYPRWITISAVAIAEVGAVLAATRWTLAGTELRSFVFLSGLVAASVALGNNQRTRRAHVATLVERAERLEHERDQQAQIAAAAERTRIAREMHDVIAHSLAVIVALADGATAKLEAEPERAGRAIRDISDVGRQALGDTRRLLGILRTEQSDDGFAPQPGIEQISELLSQVRSTGLDADLTVEGTILAIPPGAELTAYRIVQEAITNTLKHASGATKVQARVRYLPPHLEILVTDDGRGRLPGGATTSSGHGLIGMRERVAPYGGTVEAGQGPTGGWTVRATIRVTDSTGAPS